MKAIVVRAITAAETRPLRHAILRPSQPPEDCVYRLDDEPASGHFGVFADGQLVGIASIYRQSDTEGDPLAWRIRGMATREKYRGRGHGGALLAACLRHARERGGRRVRCNGRSTVLGFYSRFGFVVRGEEFEIPGLGDSESSRSGMTCTSISRGTNSSC